MNILIKDAVQVKMQATVLVYEIGGNNYADNTHDDFCCAIHVHSYFTHTGE